MKLSFVERNDQVGLTRVETQELLTFLIKIVTKGFKDRAGDGDNEWTGKVTGISS